jgi:HSP20 family protein
MPNIPFPSELPFSFQDVRNEFDRLLDRVWHVGLNTAPLDGQDWAPCIEVIEHPDRYQVRIEVAGLTAEDIEVSILENVLSARGCKQAPPAPAEGSRRLRAECRYGSFCRKFEFPTRVREDAVEAECRNGVLMISVPKAPENKGRTIKVGAGG